MASSNHLTNLACGLRKFLKTKAPIFLMVLKYITKVFNVNVRPETKAILKLPTPLTADVLYAWPPWAFACTLGQFCLID